MTVNTIKATGCAVTVACVLTHPIDVLKVRKQNWRSRVPLSVCGVAKNIFQNEGPRAFYQGLGAGFCRNWTFVGGKFLTYDVLKSRFEDQTHFGTKIGCGMTAGLFATVIGHPFDLAMVRMQASRCSYKQVFNTFRQGGAFSCLKGMSHNMKRAMVVTAAQLGGYDQTKQWLLSYGVIKTEGTPLYIASAVVAAVFAAGVSNPFDVCKTRRMSTVFKGNDTIIKIIREEGVGALLKGVGPSAGRQIPLNIIRLVCLEHFKKFFS